MNHQLLPFILEKARASPSSTVKYSDLCAMVDNEFYQGKMSITDVKVKTGLAIKLAEAMGLATFHNSVVFVPRKPSDAKPSAMEVTTEATEEAPNEDLPMAEVPNKGEGAWQGGAECVDQIMEDASSSTRCQPDSDQDM